MPWLDSQRPRPTLTGSPRATTGGAASGRDPSSPVVTYIPPLVDGASGTVPRAQKSMAFSLGQDVGRMASMLPRFLVAGWEELLARRRSMTAMDLADLLTHLSLAGVEMYTMAFAMPLWLFLPGFLYIFWLGGCVGTAYVLTTLLNGSAQVMTSTVGSEDWVLGRDTKAERWFFVGGMGTSSRHLGSTMLPALCQLFRRPISAIHRPTCGIPLDLIGLLVQRCTAMPTQSSRLLHTQLRMSLLDSSVQRVVLLSHNSGSVTASQVIAQLCADLPDTKLGKLEVYTFGAASAEFVAPLGEMAEPRQTSGDEQQDRPSRPAARTVPHFEHFAFEDDVFAQIGILGSLREDLDGRFCGGVFVIDGQGLRRAQSRTPPSLSASGGRPLRADTRLSGLSMDDYMAALFPTAQAAGGAAVVSALDSIMGIDRDLAEKRELAAIANYQALLPPSSAASPPTAKVPSRRSWTYLGATAGAAVHGVGHGGYHGLKGLEMVRQGCRGCNGHRGAEVSWLVRYVAVGDELDPREGSEGTATPIRTA